MINHRTKTWMFRTTLFASLILLALAIITGWYTAARVQSMGSRTAVVGLGNGSFVVGLSDHAGIVPSGSWIQKFDPHWRWWWSTVRTPSSYQHMIPLWMPALLLLALAWWIRPPRKPAPNHCPACGYDLAELESNACPECGVSHA